MQHLQKTGGGGGPHLRRCNSSRAPRARLKHLPGKPRKNVSSAIISSRGESERGMSARILDGLKIRDQVFAELQDEISLLTAMGVRPGLAAVLVGEDPASQLYVKSKIAACEQLGMASGLIRPPASATTAELLAVVEDLNRDNDTDGILVQLP